jgi:hypothetical protein
MTFGWTRPNASEFCLHELPVCQCLYRVPVQTRKTHIQAMWAPSQNFSAKQEARLSFLPMNILRKVLWRLLGWAGEFAV